MKLIILLFAVAHSLVDTCRLEELTVNDKESCKVATHFDNLMKDSSTIGYECLDFLIQRGFYSVAVELYEQHFIFKEIDVSKQLQELLEKDPTLASSNTLQHIFSHAISKSKKIQTVQPMISWAQSKNHTLINIKFSHRADAPACLNPKIEVITLESGTMHIRAFGIVSHHPIRYEVKLDLFKSIDASTSFSKHEGVGTMIFNLTKLEPNDLWIRLTQQKIKVPIWWDLKDNLKEDMEEFIQMLETASDKNEKSSEQKYRRKQKERAQQKKKQEQLDQEERTRQTLLERNQCYHTPGKCEIGWYQRQ